MLKQVKATIYQYLFRTAPKRVQEIYFRTKVLVPKEELTQKYSEAIEYLKKNGTLGDYLEFGTYTHTEQNNPYTAKVFLVTRSQTKRE